MDSIVFIDFTKNYGNFTAVDHINLNVQSGTITGFIGKNGAGKSTTLRAMVNILSPTYGKILINGLDSVKKAKEIKHFLSYMPSDAAFYENVTACDLFRLCAKFNGIDFHRALNLAEYFELNIHKKISALSLGNRKKVSIIQAFMKDSKLFVMDEPTSGLDPFMQEKFFHHLLERKKQGATFFLSSHNLGEIEKYCDQAVIIKSGKIVDQIDIKSAQIKKKQIVSYVTADGVSRKFTYDGQVNDLIAKLADLDLKSVEIKSASIEEDFTRYYENDRKDEDASNA